MGPAPTAGGDLTGRPGVRRVLDATFRANHAFRLVAQSELTGAPRELLDGLSDRAGHFGVLAPRRGRGLSVHAVDTAAASLYRLLGQPGPLPAEVQAEGAPANLRVAALVLDGILEIEAPGGFRSGPAAHPEVFERPLAAPQPGTRVAELSFAALRGAVRLPLDEPRQVSGWLYRYNTVAAGPRLARRLRPSALPDAVGLSATGPVARRLEESYRHGQTEAWLSWDRRENGDIRGTPKHKIYVSPAPVALAEAVPRAVECLVDHGAPAFKLGADARGLLRPDKLMIYLHSRDELLSLAAHLHSRLAGLAPQGVPFSAALDEQGMLSWGVDPPHAERIRGLPGWESWRVWVTGRLAGALVAARRVFGDGEAAWWYALDRVRLDGIEPHTWLPDAAGEDCGLWAGDDDDG